MIDTDDDLTLRQDVLSVLVECHRDQQLADFRDSMPAHTLNVLAESMARRLAPRIGGRYVPKGLNRSGADERAARDAAVWATFTGANHREVMRQFGISRRLLYSILARMRRHRKECSVF